MSRRLLLITSYLLAIHAACSDSTAVVYPAGIKMAPADTSIPQLATFTPHVTVFDSGGRPIPLRPTLTSSDSAIVAVTPQGALRSVGPVGTVLITAILGPFVDQMIVRVHDSTITARLALPGSPLAVAVRGDIAYVSRPSAGRIQVLSLTSLTFVDSIAVGSIPCGIVFNSTGTKGFIANQGSRNVGIIDVASRVQSSVIPLNGDPLPVAISPSDSVLFVTTNVNRLYKIDLRTNTIVDSLPLPATSHHLLAHPNDTLVYVATRDAGSVLEVNWRTMSIARTFTLGGRTQGMALAPDRLELYVVNELSNALHVVTLSSGSATNIALEAGAHSITLGADGTKLYVGLLFAGKINVLNRVARTFADTILTQGVVRWMAADPARGRVIVANEAGWVNVLP